MKKSLNIFVLQPFTKESKFLFDEIVVVAALADCVIERADGDYKNNILTHIESKIKKCDLVIADISNGNANVMYELGLAHSVHKPVLFISRYDAGIPFDLTGFLRLIYDPKDIKDFSDRLFVMIQKVKENPAQLTQEKLAIQKAEKSRVFISYSHNDKEYLDRLLVHLKPLSREGIVDLWVDTKLNAGDRWKDEITKELASANVYILLISADFLASDFIVNNELPPILKNAEQQGTKILPVIVKHCRYTRDVNLKHFQSINDPKMPIAGLDENGKEETYDKIGQEVERSLQRPA